jgi:hypothetical protein
MKAVVVHQYGGPEVLKFEECPDPVPGPGEVAYRTKSYCLNEPSRISDASAKASGAARIAEGYLLRGYSRKRAADVKVAAFRDLERAELFCSQLVARAYEEVELWEENNGR